MCGLSSAVKIHFATCRENPEGRVEFSFTLSLTLSLDGRWSMPHPNCFTPGKVTWYPLYRRLGGPQGQSGQVWKLSPPPWSDQPIVSHYINYAIHPSSAVVVCLYQFQGLLQDQLL